MDVESAAERARVAAERAAEDARVVETMEAFAAAESRVAWLSRYVERYAAALAGYEAGRAYQVELVADAMARGTRRGRPSAAAEVAAVLAVDADPRIGRHALPGRDHTAGLVGCSTRAVTRAWEALESVGWCRRVRQGGSVPLARRAELGRSMDRAEFQLRLLVAEDCAGHGPHMAAAAAVYAGLLARTAAMLAEAQGELDALRRAHGGRQEPGEVARRARLRHVVRQALAAPRLTAAGNFVSPSGGLQVSTEGSGLSWGLLSPQNSPHTRHLLVRPIGRNGLTGASPTNLCADFEWGCRRSQHTQRPRPIRVSGRRSQRRARPEWAVWAVPLARELRHVVGLLAEEHPTRLAATLGGHLAPCQPDGTPWDVTALVDVLEARGGALPTSATAPLALLRARIRALPDRYRRPDRVAAERHAVVRDQAAELAARRAERAREHQAQADAVAASDPARSRVARRLARWSIRPTGTGGRCVGCDTTSGVAARPHGRHQVPLCSPCTALVNDQGWTPNPPTRPGRSRPATRGATVDLAHHDGRVRCRDHRGRRRD